MIAKLKDRGHWGSRLGFILAATGSAVGLGNIWKFPYIAGHYGGGLFVLVYLACIAVVGVPVLVAEVILGRATQCSPAGAFKTLRGPGSGWGWVGWLGVASGFIILSFYSVVAGWSLHYTYLALTSAFADLGSTDIDGLFGRVYATGRSTCLHFVVMLLTVGIVVGGVSKGIESVVTFLMPALFLLLAILMFDAMTLDGFDEALSFVFSVDKGMSAQGFIEALGHSFFTLSLGMGAMLTYGSYLNPDDDIPTASFVIGLLDTVVALSACMIIFPVIFTFGIEPSAGPGLVFKSIPIALNQMPAGNLLLIAFFALLFFAALSSAISLLEVVVSSAIDQLDWSRARATLTLGAAILVLGVPSALSGSTALFSDTWASVFFGKTFFDSFDWLSSAVLLPLGGFLIAMFAGWFLPEEVRRREFTRGSRFASQYPIWLFFIRWVTPVAMIVVFLFSVGILPKDLLGP
ncbi:MAG: sodium-dependent transporter [Myxococcales bacterium]|nr:sodium-dependent transporter [Myxococcales bacterium]